MTRALAVLVVALSLTNCAHGDRDIWDIATESMLRGLCNAAQSTKADSATNCGRTQPARQPI